MQGIERVEVNSAALLSFLQAEQDAAWEMGALERHDPGKHNQKTHGDWAHPGIAPSSGSPPASSTTGSSASSSSSPSATAHMSAALASKAAFYQGLASHPISKTWTAQDQQLAAQMAKDFQAISDGLKSGKDVTSLVADMTKAAQSLHDAAPTHMTQARLDVMNGMQKRITHALGQHSSSSSSSSSSGSTHSGSSSSGSSSSGHSGSSHSGSSGSTHHGSSSSHSGHTGSSSTHHSGSSSSGSTHHSGGSGSSTGGHTSSGSSHHSGSSSSGHSSSSSGHHSSSSGHSSGSSSHHSGSSGSSGSSGHSSHSGSSSSGSSHHSSSHSGSSSHGSSSSKGGSSGSSGSSKSSSGSSSSGSGSASPQAERMSSVLADKSSFYSDLASKPAGKNWTKQDQQIASQMAQDMQTISDGLKSGKDVSAQIADMVKSAQSLHEAAPSHMTETQLDVMTGLQKRIGNALSPQAGQQKRMLDSQDALERRDYSQAERDQMDESDFAGPHQSFPIKTQQDVYNAARLIGHADDPAAVKAKIKAIAKRKGLKLPDSWQEEDDSSDKKERSMSKNGNHAPFTGTHSHPHPAFGSQGSDEMHSHEHSHDNDAIHDHSHDDDAADTADRSVRGMASQDFSLYLPIVRTDATQRRVFGQATIEQPDAYGTIFGFYPDAWKKWRGNIREQHDPKKAVGKALEVIPDEQRRAIDVDLKVSRGAQDTWLKVEDGVLTGLSASIIPDPEYGNDIRKWPQKEYDGKKYPYLPRYSVVELSLVDNPATPGCNIQIVRAQGGASLATDILDTSEETGEPVAQPLERAGARLSGATRDAMHESIKHTLHAASSLMQNCGCDTCQKAGKALDPDGDGDIDLGGYDDTDGDADQMDRSADDFMVSKLQDRMMSALERSLAPVYSRQHQFLAQLARANSDYTSVREQLESLTATVERLANSNSPSLERVLADLSAVKVEVEKIAAQPMPGGPVLNGARPVDKTLATDPYRGAPREATQDVLARMQQLGALDTIDKQVAAAALAAQPVRGPYSR